VRHEEHQHQVALIAWAHRVRIQPASDIEPGATIATYLLAVPNGGKRSSPREGARLKAEGVKPGVSDLLLPLRRGGFCGLWLEMKAPGAKPTKLQAEWLARMARAGYRAEWRDSWTAAAMLITDYLDGSQDLANTINPATTKGQHAKSGARAVRSPGLG
jgi:hypothetical protein